jgi:hypothetical protein
MDVAEGERIVAIEILDPTSEPGLSASQPPPSTPPDSNPPDSGSRSSDPGEPPNGETNGTPSDE